MLDTPNTYSQEVNGQVTMEAEHFTWSLRCGTRPWLTQTTVAGSTGEGYLSALPDTDLRFDTPYTPTNPELHYTVNFTTTGVYTVWLRGYAPNAAGDSVYVGLDDSPAVALTGFAPQQWGWASSNTQDEPVTVEITEPGLHILQFWMREDGLRLDRIVLTTDSNYNPIGSGPGESERFRN